MEGSKTRVNPPNQVLVLTAQKVLSCSGRAGISLHLMGKYIEYLIAARLEPNNTFVVGLYFYQSPQDPTFPLTALGNK